MFTITGMLVYAGCQWFSLWGLKLLGDDALVGKFALAAAINAPIYQFIRFELRKLHSTDSTEAFALSDYLGLRTSGVIFALLLSVGISFSVGYPAETLWVIFWVSIAKTVEAISDALHGRLHQQERLDQVAISQIAHAVVMLFCLLATVYFTGSLVMGAMASALARVTLLFVCDLSLIWKLETKLRIHQQDARSAWSYIWPRWEWRKQTALIKLSFALGLSALLSSLNTNIPRYFVEAHLGEAALGTFSLVCALMLIGTYLFSAMGYVVAPKVAQAFNSGNYQKAQQIFLVQCGLYFLAGTAAVILSWLIGKQLLMLCFGASYGQYHHVLILLMVANITHFLSGATYEAMIALRQTQLPFYLFGLSAVICLISCFFLVPSYGMEGAALSLSFSKIPCLIISFIAIMGKIHSHREEPVLLPLSNQMKKNYSHTQPPMTSSQSHSSEERPSCAG